MSTTCSTIVSRAQAFSPLNSALTSDRAEMLTRIRADQRVLYADITTAACDRFQTTASVTSTSGASGRTVDLSTLTPPLGRLLTVTLPSGVRVRQVDVEDQDGTHAPRYLLRGLTLTEVSNDWSGTTGTVALTLAYITAPTDLDPTGDLTQAVSLPDEWTDLLIVALARYLFQKDPGRDPGEGQRLDALYAARLSAFRAYLGLYGGDRFGLDGGLAREGA